MLRHHQHATASSTNYLINKIMTLSIKYAMVPLLASITLLSIPFGVMAYDDLRVEVYFDDGRIEVDVDYYENGREIEREYVFNTTNLDEAYRLTADELNISVAAVEDAVVRIDRDDDADDDDDDRWDDDSWGDRERKDDVRDASYYRNSTRTDAREAIRDAKEEITEAARYVERHRTPDQAQKSLAEARQLVADAEVFYAKGQYGNAEYRADKAEDLAEAITDNRPLPKAEIKSPAKEMIHASSDRDALQKQLLALLQQLIALLQAQQQ